MYTTEYPFPHEAMKEARPEGDLSYLVQPYVLTSHQPFCISRVSSILQYNSLIYIGTPEPSREPRAIPKYDDDLNHYEGEPRKKTSDFASDASCITRVLSLAPTSRVAELLQQRQRNIMLRPMLRPPKIITTPPIAPVSLSETPAVLVSSVEPPVARIREVQMADHSLAARQKLDKMKKLGARCSIFTGKRRCRRRHVFVWKCCATSNKTCMEHALACVMCGQKMCPLCRKGKKTCTECK